MQAQYHPGPSPEAMITATPAEFATMAGRVAELAAAGSGEEAFPAAGRGLAAVVVRIGSGLAVVEASKGDLSVSGGPEAVGLFGRNLPVEPSLPGGYHVHFDDCEGAGHVDQAPLRQTLPTALEWLWRGYLGGI